MKNKELYARLSKEQTELYNHLIKNGYSVYIFEQDGDICAEIENYTSGGVDMIVNLLPFNFEELKEYAEDFDIDEEIETRRLDKRYRDAFRISESLKDFETWLAGLKETIERFSKK